MRTPNNRCLHAARSLHPKTVIASAAALAVTALLALSAAGCDAGPVAGEGGLEILLPDLHSRVGAPVLATVTAPDAARLRLSVTDPSGATTLVADVAAPSTPRARVGTLDLRGWDRGAYRLSARVLDAKGGTVATWYRRVVRRTGAPSVAFDENNALLRDGDPFFMVGQWMPHMEADGANEPSALAREGRTNTVLAQGLRSKPGTRAFDGFLAECEGYGLAGIGLARGGDYDPEVRDAVSSNGGSRSVLAWMWIDEPEYNRVSPARAREWTEQAHAADANHPVLINLVGSHFVGQGGRESSARRYTSDLIESGKPLPADWISTDYYPIAFSRTFGTDLQTSFDNFAEHLARVRSWTFGLYPTATFIEVASQPDQGSDAVPTPQQVWAETWIAVVSGVRGIVWFPFGGGIDEGTPKVQSKATRYLTALAPVLARPDSPAIRREHLTGSRVDFLVKEHAGLTYVFAVNRDVDSAAQVRFTPTRGRSIERVTVYGESMDVEADADGFVDELAPYGVRIYVVRMQ